MLVINSNNQPNTTNYMLTDPGYPDPDSILMQGCPNFFFDDVAIPNGGDIEKTPSDITTVDIVGTYPINLYCPKINREILFSGQSFKTSITTMTSYNTLPPDIGFLNKGAKFSTNNYSAARFKFGYNIAVKGLSAGQVVGEKIYAPLLIGTTMQSGGNSKPGFILYTNASNYYSSNPYQVIFKLLHTDGTTTTIATINLSVLCHNLNTTSFGANYTTSITSDGQQLNGSLFTSVSDTNFGYLRLEGRYSGTGQTAQEGDMLVAEVRVAGVFCGENSGSSGTIRSTCGGVYGGGVNNNDMRDIYGFRPFQVSIRDA